jgi:hypothetical protein
MFEIPQRELVEIVTSLAGVKQIACDHRVELDALQLDSRAAEDNVIVFQILSDFSDIWVLQNWSQRISDQVWFEDGITCGSTYGDIETFAWPDGEGISDNSRKPGVDIGRFGVDGDKRLLRKTLRKFRKLFWSVNDITLCGGSGGLHLRRRLLIERRDSVSQRAKTELAEQFLDPHVVYRAIPG